MKTAELIDKLSDKLAPVPRRAVARTLLLGVGGGALVSFVLMWVALGFRTDLATAIGTSGYWMKFFYTLSLGIVAFWIAERLARPGTRSIMPMSLLVVPVAVLLILAWIEMHGASPDQRMHMMMGASARVCPWMIVLLSLPVFAGSFWAMSRLAPTRLALAGAAAGILAGAFGAWIYAFHCDESTAPFVVIWYTLGIAAVGAFGGFLGRYVLRW